MRDNPFSLDFGAQTNLYIPRLYEQNKIISTFMSDKPSSHMFLILGARGSGKTVLMTAISHRIKLVTIDEVVNSKNVREFTTYFQHCIREELPVFVLMTGLYKNVRALQNNKSQTFLKSAPKITIGPLSNRRIAKQYEEVFGLNEDSSFELAAQTNGYSYGFQILGYSLFDQNKSILDDKVLFEYQTNLEECSYEKIWEELSPSERDVVKAIAKEEDNVQVKEVREKLGLDSNNFSTYQTTLENSGILDNTAAFGRLRFTLPYFKGMRTLSTNPETVENLEEQQRNVLKARIEWKMEIIKKMGNILTTITL